MAPTKPDVPPVPPEVLVDRTCTVAAITAELRREKPWGKAGDAPRREQACKFAFALWAINRGVINDRDEPRAWSDEDE